MILSSIDSPAGKTTDLIIGEKIKGVSSGAVAVYAELYQTLKYHFYYLMILILKRVNQLILKNQMFKL